ncbi:N-acetylglucosaminyl transferase component family protein/Gpi1 family protein [Forsythia ovata]|uniref:N-acetylglucosaminyl transferase component family protein/Gpi1 family protein n=1 Tax=Forsythia ovata TaxID=205694 RepID=A0ABD1X8C3_9LAMI
MKRRKCRLWWPAYLCSKNELRSSTFLFGWSISTSVSSLDIIVAFGSDEAELSSSITPDLNLLPGILHETNQNMPAFLQDKCIFSLLGYYETDLGANGQFPRVGNDRDKHVFFSSQEHKLTCSQNIHEGNLGRWSCGCHKFDSLLEQHRITTLEKNPWVKLVYGFSETVNRKICLIPKLDHVHWEKETLQLDLHVVVYDIPTFGGHHYSLGSQRLFSQVKSSCKKPKWFEDLHQKDPNLDLDAVTLAMNSATAARMFFQRNLHARRSASLIRVVCLFSTFVWKLFAASVASLSTFFYIILQFLHVLCSSVSQSFIYITLENVFSNTQKNIQIRCFQLLYWPIFLQDHGIRSRSCVEFAEKAALHKHSMWSSIVVDVLIGNLLGHALWFQAECACLWVSNFANDITDYWLRTGCVWLMGNPAGFKLNTELAGVLGMISLNAIQIWSTLWFFMSFVFIHFTKGLAICGILLGSTVAAALIIDVISLVTTHVLTLHSFLSLVYSQQIQAIAALWRLFRGRKWNSLRQRLDSYDYSVEQHVVGSLLFTLLLLLLPTTSAFYIFFTILKTAVSFICMVVEVAISLIHVTPYAKIFLWSVRKKRFPSGIWFEILSREQTAINYSEIGTATRTGSSCGKLQQTDTGGSKSSVLVSFLHSNYLSLGEVVSPHYRCVYSAISRSSIASLAYGVLTGRSVPSGPGTALRPKMPWMVLPWREYWRLCRDAIYACKADGYCHLHQ